jgi:putative spermidine/putrescine transport system substrate-binding protein
MLPGTYEGDQPMTWADFFDVEKFPGDRAWPAVDYYNGVFEAALLGDGVPPEEVYPLDFERAKAKIRSIWDNLVFYDTFPASQQLLSSGTAAMGFAPNGLWAGLQRDGVDTEIIWTATPILAQNNEVIIPGAPNLENVQALAAFCNDGERQAQFALATNYGPPATAAFDFMTEEEAANLPTAPGREVLITDVQFIAENDALMAEENLDLFAG